MAAARLVTTCQTEMAGIITHRLMYFNLSKINKMVYTLTEVYLEWKIDFSN